MHDAIVDALGAGLRRIREDLGLTQTQAVDRLRETTGVDIHHKTLGMYETGSRTMSVRRLLELSDTYHTSGPALLAEAIRVAGQDPSCPTCGRAS